MTHNNEYCNQLLRIILKNSITIDAEEAWELAKTLERITRMKTHEELVNNAFKK